MWWTVTDENELSSSTGSVIGIVKIHKSCTAKSSIPVNKGKMHIFVLHLSRLISRNVTHQVLKHCYETLSVTSALKEEKNRNSLCWEKSFLLTWIILIIFYHAKLGSFQNSTFHFLSKYAHYAFICTFSYKNGRITVNLIEQQTSTFVSIICLSFSLIPRKSPQTYLSIFIPKYRFFLWIR